MTYRTPIALAALAFATPLAAQTADQPAPPASTEVTPPQPGVPTTNETRTLNKAVAAIGNDAQKTNAENQAQYDADVAAYRAAVQAHARASMSDAARYERQQRAYADAMAAWRAQTADCKAGKTKGCNAPTPDPANYY